MTSSAVEAREWTKTEIAKEVTFQVLNIGEKIVTYDIINDDDLNVEEGNTWVYGSNPSKEKLALVGLGTGLLHLWITDHLIDHETDDSVALFQDLSLTVYGGVFMWNLHFKF